MNVKFWVTTLEVISSGDKNGDGKCNFVFAVLELYFYRMTIETAELYGYHQESHKPTGVEERLNMQHIICFASIVYGS